MVPMMRLPFIMNFMFPVPEASVPAVEICWDSSVPAYAQHTHFRAGTAGLPYAHMLGGNVHTMAASESAILWLLLCLQ